jgi:hypothetical protein
MMGSVLGFDGIRCVRVVPRGEAVAAGLADGFASAVVLVVGGT